MSNPTACNPDSPFRGATIAPVLVLAAQLAACGGSSPSTGARLEARLAPAGAGSLTPSSAPGLGSSNQALVGANRGGGLQNLKYYIRVIQICQDLHVTGSGFDTADGCINVFEQPGDSLYQYDPTLDYSYLADEARASDTGFIDVMAPAGTPAFLASTPLNSTHVGSYGWGVMLWYPPIKFTAEIAMNDGSTLYTRDGTTALDPARSEPNNPRFLTTADSAFASGPAVEAVIVPTNGGSWFRFQKPFEITQADVDAAETLSVDLAFNPDGMVKGYTAPCTDFDCGFLRDPADNRIQLDFLEVTPVPHRATESVTKETYLATLTEKKSGSSFDLRLEVYFVTEDPGQALYGIDLRTLPNAQSVSTVPSVGRVSFVESRPGGTLELQDFARKPQIKGFARAAAIGDVVKATVDCTAGSALAGVLCANPPIPGDIAPVDLKLVTRGVLN